ncbi:MAG: lipoate--protein ligase [Bacteroidales bacterium]|jgi:lipoate-protein ligase A|nr:lipoate--protein ligase [Bacteroidales bacterium]
MLCIWLSTQEPQRNLATEEYLVKNFTEDIFMLWQNAPSIIIGKHQNALSEINIEYVNEHNINVVRRMTGGGAVFHDLGNLNFTFIKNINKNDKTVDFKPYIDSVIYALAKLEVEAKFEGRNDITIDGKKISGNAMAFHDNRVLSHGTLLFSTIMSDLSNALKVDQEKFNDKAVKSVRSRVTNISEHLKTPMTVLEFKDKIMESIVEQAGDYSFYQFTSDDLIHIDRLEKEKYRTWEWNFGKSPQYNFSKKARTLGGTIEVMLNVIDGVMEKVHFYGDFFTQRNIDELESQLIGKKHDKDLLNAFFDAIPLSEYFNNVDKKSLISLFF